MNTYIPNSISNRTITKSNINIITSNRNIGKSFPEATIKTNFIKKKISEINKAKLDSSDNNSDKSNSSKKMIKLKNELMMTRMYDDSYQKDSDKNMSSSRSIAKHNNPPKKCTTEEEANLERKGGSWDRNYGALYTSKGSLFKKLKKKGSPPEFNI